MAIEYKNQEAFEKLLNHPDINVHLKDNLGRLPLHSAIEYKNQEAFEKLLNHPDINVNLGDDYAHKWTPMHYAIAYKNQEAFEALLNRPEIDVNLGNKGKLTPLHMAVLSDDARMVQTLLEKFKEKIEIDAQNINQETPLYQVKSAEVMKLLLDYGADIHQKIGVKGKEVSLAERWSRGWGGEEKKMVPRISAIIL